MLTIKKIMGIRVIVRPRDIHVSSRLLSAWRRILVFPTINIVGHTNDWVAANTNVAPNIDVGFSGMTTNITTIKAKHNVTAQTDFILMMLVFS